MHLAEAREKDRGQRLDKFLSASLPQLSRSRIQALLGEGQVALGSGETITDASRKVKPGERFKVTIPPLRDAKPKPQAATLDLLYEDAHLLVLNKPAGMTVHPAPGNPDRTLVNALLAHCGDSLSGIGGVARPGIVHRIDKDTSGLLVVAKHDAAHRNLSAQLAARTLKRQYFALVWGAPRFSSRTVEAPIARSPRDRKKMAIVKGGKHAVTHYRVEERYGSPPSLASLLALSLETGRTHQIRVHMQYLSHPLIGDSVYGGVQKGWLTAASQRLPPEAFTVLEQFGRQALHAHCLGLIHPVTGENMSFKAPLPDDFETLLCALGACME